MKHFALMTVAYLVLVLDIKTITVLLEYTQFLIGIHMLLAACDYVFASGMLLVDCPQFENVMEFFWTVLSEISLYSDTPIKCVINYPATTFPFMTISFNGPVVNNASQLGLERDFNRKV